MIEKIFGIIVMDIIDDLSFFLIKIFIQHVDVLWWTDNNSGAFCLSRLS